MQYRTKVNPRARLLKITILRREFIMHQWNILKFTAQINNIKAIKLLCNILVLNFAYAYCILKF